MQPLILLDKQLNGISVRKRKKINDMLEEKGVPQLFHIMAVGYSGAGNIKITSTHMSKASDLMKYGDNITKIITINKILSILPNMEHYWVKINEVLTWCGNDNPMTIDLIHKELQTYLLEYELMKQWQVPCWLGNDDTICAKNSASIIIDLTNKLDRDTLLEIAHIKLFNFNFMITLCKEQPQVFQCTNCTMICSSKTHNTDNHPPKESPKCVNCKG